MTGIKQVDPTEIILVDCEDLIDASCGKFVSFAGRIWEVTLIRRQETEWQHILRITRESQKICEDILNKKEGREYE